MSAKCACEQWFDNADDDEPGVRGHAHRDAGDGCTAPGCACEFNATRIFKSHQANLDPKPYVHRVGDRSTVARIGYVHDPRPEFEPTRDPLPYKCGMKPNQDIRHGHADERFCSKPAWAPRREQFDTPVNRVLEQFREYARVRVHTVSVLASATVEVMDSGGFTQDFTPDEIDHARKVLTRLAGWSA